jgi:hypothetical protein
LPKTPQKALLTKANASMALYLHVCKTELVIAWVSAPFWVRLPPQTLRLTIEKPDWRKLLVRAGSDFERFHYSVRWNQTRN